LAIDTREKELREKLVQAKTELRKLNNRKKNIANSGVTDADISAQEDLVEAAEKDLTTFRDERISRLGGGKKQREQEDLVKKQDELKELERRSLEGEFAPKPGVFRGGVPEREVRISDINRAKKQVEKRQPEVSEEEQPPGSASERQLDEAELKKLQSGSSLTTKQIISGFSSDDFKNIQVAGTAGTYAVLDKFDQDPVGYYILPTDATGTSRFIAVTDFVNNLYTLDSDIVSEYQKALNLSVSGVMNPMLEEKIRNLVDNVSYLNYRNALAGNSKQIKWEEALVDPAKFNLGKTLGTGSGPSPEQVKVKTESIKVISTELGIDLDNNNLQKLARDWASGLYDATTIKSQIARLGNIDFTKGLAGETVSVLKQYASDFGVQYDDSWFTRAATNILKAKESEDTYNNEIREIAKSRYPTLSSQIDAGFTVRQLASPYLQSMSRVLEIDAGTIGLEDPTITRSLTGLNQEGKPGTTPLWQFEQELRKDPRWNFTKNAQDSLMNTTRKVLQDFGLVY
jgi:hypothetical protein